MRGKKRKCQIPPPRMVQVKTLKRHRLFHSLLPFAAAHCLTMSERVTAMSDARSRPYPWQLRGMQHAVYGTAIKLASLTLSPRVASAISKKQASK